MCSWPSMRRSRWLDIGQVVFCLFMDQDKVKVMGPSFHLDRLPFRTQGLLQLATCRFSYIYITRRVIREIKYRIYGKREFVPRDQFSPLLVINLLFIITARKSVDSLQFCPCFELFYLLISHFENFLTWISRLLFDMNAMLNHDFGHDLPDREIYLSCMTGQDLFASPDYLKWLRS